MDSTNAFVLDGPATLVWGFAGEGDDSAAAILDRMPDLQAHVPNLWPLEVADALLVGERRGRPTPADAARFLAILGTFPVAIDEETVARAWVETAHLARARALRVRRVVSWIVDAPRPAPGHARREAEGGRECCWHPTFRRSMSREVTG